MSRAHLDWLYGDSPRTAWQARAIRCHRAGQRALRSPSMLLGSAIVLLMLLVALLADWLAPHDPHAQNLALRLLAPGQQPGYWLGTDQLGRDLLSRVVYGTRPTLLIVALVALLSAPLGLTVGLAAAYFGGWVNRLLMRLTDIFMALPKLVLALALVAALGPGLVNAVIAIGITAWPAYARLARTEALLALSCDYLQAARMQGLPGWRILTGQLLPMCLGSTIIRVSLDMAGIILTAAGLGFLGLGAQPPMAEWGAMVAAGRQTIFDQWWVAGVPGVAILLGSLAFNLLGDGLRDVLDPRHA